MNETEWKKIEIAFDIIVKDIPEELNPRIGGSCALYIQNQVDNFNDIDIVLDNVDNVDLKYPTVPPIHPKKMNKVKSYDVHGVKVDLIERITPLVECDVRLVEPIGVVRTAQSILYSYCLRSYGERIEKWEYPNKGKLGNEYLEGKDNGSI